MYRTRIGQVVSAVSAQDRLYATFERSSDPMILLGPDDRRIVDANEAYGRLTAAPPSTALAETARGRLALAAPSRRASSRWLGELAPDAQQALI